MAEEKVVAAMTAKKANAAPTLESFFRDAAGNRVMKHQIAVTVDSKNRVVAVVQPLGGGVARQFNVEGDNFVAVDE